MIIALIRWRRQLGPIGLVHICAVILEHASLAFSL
jgi:hypothetical protein